MITAQEANLKTRNKTIIKEIESLIETLIDNGIDNGLYNCTFNFDLNTPIEIQAYIIQKLRDLGYEVSTPVTRTIIIEWLI